MYAVMEIHPEFPDQPWFWDGAGWTNEPVYFYSTEEAAVKHAKRLGWEVKGKRFAVVKRPTYH